MSNYATRSGVKKATDVDISDFAKKTDLVSLKWIVDELDIDKLKTIPTDLGKLNDLVENEIVEKSTYDELVKK